MSYQPMRELLDRRGLAQRGVQDAIWRRSIGLAGAPIDSSCEGSRKLRWDDTAPDREEERDQGVRRGEQRPVSFWRKSVA
jgi:hypothetical protein